MQAALFALAGVILGAAIPAVVALVTAGRERQRADDDRQDARDARLFDHRQTAYADYIATSRQLLDVAWDVRFKMTPEPDLDVAFSSLQGALSRVALYGTAAALKAAQIVAHEATNFFLEDYSPDELATAWDDLQAGLDKFTDRARRDLGVPE